MLGDPKSGEACCLLSWQGLPSPWEVQADKKLARTFTGEKQIFSPTCTKPDMLKCCDDSLDKRSCARVPSKKGAAAERSALVC